MLFDLHSHTLHSDGSLTPAELLSRAAEYKVDVLSITDHDTVAAHLEPSLENRVRLVPGIELSTRWQSIGVHILGLDIDPHSDAITTAVQQQSKARLTRARKIAEKLHQLGIENAYDGARSLSAGDYVGRPHFARYLVEAGYVDSMESAFRKFLGDGKPGDVKELWADMPTVIDWIRGAGGQAVLAHPLKYKLTRTRLRRLLADFIKAGGAGMEVISGRQLPDYTRSLGQLANELGLLASCGSDFHSPGPAWSELGKFSALPGSVTPVWEKFG